MTNKLLTVKKLSARTATGLGVLALVMFACSMIGTESISLKNIFVGPDLQDGFNIDYEIFVHVRVPRIILAAVIGAALACSGVVFQGLLRNPLADPYILGISSGAGLGAVLAILTGLSWSFCWGSSIAVCAFAGALGTVWLVWGIGRFTGKSHITGLLLAGVVVNAFFSAVIMFLTSIAGSERMHMTIFWLMGNLNMAAIESFHIIWISAACVITGILALFYISPQLNVLSFGEADARTIGVNITRIQVSAFAVAALITAVAVSLSGLIGFAGLIVPHGVRLVFGPDHRQLIPLSAVTGAIFLVAADTIARIIVAPAQLPVGVITALVGGPFFLILLVRYTRKVSWFGK